MYIVSILGTEKQIIHKVDVLSSIRPLSDGTSDY